MTYAFNWVIKGGLSLLASLLIAAPVLAEPFAYLRANDPTSRINVRKYPTSESYAPHYGLPGDRVEILEEIDADDGYTWYYVKFVESGAEGWIRGDLIAIDYNGCHFEPYLDGFNCS
ncbi:MAG: SH3 domain-containing protein [Cyanobacteria bacterium P01_H01_bin.15]